jgi:hypothetical protein
LNSIIFHALILFYFILVMVHTNGDQHMWVVITSYECIVTSVSTTDPSPYCSGKSVYCEFSDGPKEVWGFDQTHYS